MAPTRGFRRAVVAVAATIIAARFSVFQRSQTAPKPVPVRTVTGVTAVTPLVTPTVRAPPIQNTTQLKRRKVAVFYNVYAPPRPHNRTCTSSKTWHIAPAPRYRPGHPYYKYSSMGGSSCGIKERSKLDAVLSEWSDIYGASPPADSRLLAHYMTTPPEAPPVKLRRKAGYDAGSAFQRWARRRVKGE